MKKALLISPVFPDENGGGREKRAHQWVNKLSKDYELSLLVVSSDKGIAVNLNNLDLGDFYTVHVEPGSFLKKWLSLCFALFCLLFAKTRDSIVLGWIPFTSNEQKQLERFEWKKFDYILCFRLYLKDYARFIQKLTKCEHMDLDMDDIESVTRDKIATLLMKRKHMKLGILNYASSLYFRLQEKSIDSIFSKIYVCSTEDQVFLQKKELEFSISVMPNRIYQVTQNLPLPSNSYQLLFVGSLSYYPNEEAVTWFIQHVLPELRNRDKRWILHVAGIGGSELLVNMLKKAEGVQYHGQVENLKDIYLKTYIVISPLHAGGGTKLKVMEAMWYGRPVIATYESVHGLGLTDSVHYLLAETVNDFVYACEELATNRHKAKQMIRSANEVMNEKFIYE